MLGCQCWRKLLMLLLRIIRADQVLKIPPAAHHHLLLRCDHLIYQGPPTIEFDQQDIFGGWNFEKEVKEVLF